MATINTHFFEMTRQGNYIGPKSLVYPMPRQHGKPLTFAERFGASTMTQEAHAVFNRMPKEGKFLAIYKDVDDNPQWVTSDLKVLPHTVDQYAWVDGKLYEHDPDCEDWDVTDPMTVARYLSRNAKGTSLAFMSMGDTVVFEEKKLVVERKG